MSAHRYFDRIHSPDPGFDGTAYDYVCECGFRFATSQSIADDQSASSSCSWKFQGDYFRKHVAQSSALMADAKRAGLLAKQGPWSQYTGRMLRIRATSSALNRLRQAAEGDCNA